MKAWVVYSVTWEKLSVYHAHPWWAKGDLQDYCDSRYPDEYEVLSKL